MLSAAGYEQVYSFWELLGILWEVLPFGIIFFGVIAYRSHRSRITLSLLVTSGLWFISSLAVRVVRNPVVGMQPAGSSGALHRYFVITRGLYVSEHLCFFGFAIALLFFLRKVYCRDKQRI